MGAEAKLERIPGTDDRPAWTVTETRLPEAIGFVPTLSCFPRGWRHPPPAFAPRDDQRPVEVESVAFAERFVARVNVHQERNWLLQLLSPAFLAWLTDGAHNEFGFELHEGTLRCFRPGELDDAAAAALQEEAQRVAERVRSEALEAEGLGVRDLGSGVSERVERAVDAVRFTTLPPDSLAASLPFRAVAARDPRVYIAALGGVVTAFGLLLWLLFEIGLDAIDLLIAIIDWVGPDNTAIALGIFALIGWLAAIPGAISIASHPYGRVAFAREYARARGLRLESPQSFHRRLMRLELPAPAQFVLSGPLGEEGQEGWLALCRTRTRFLHTYHDAIVLPLPDGAIERSGGDFEVQAGHLVVTRASSADRSAAGLDSFTGHALTARARLVEDAPSAGSEAQVAGSDGDQLDMAEGELEETGAELPE